MNVLLIKLELKDTQIYPPYGLLYVASALMKAGYTTEIFHEAYSKKNLNRLYNIIGMQKPDLIGFSVVTDYSLQYAVSTSREINNFYPDIPIVWGGVHATCLPNLCLSEAPVRYVVIGEGEETIVQLMDKLRNSPGQISGIKGLGLKENNHITINEKAKLIKNLDEYPIPWPLIDIRKYISNGWLSFMTSRGCPYNCGFCFNSFMYKCQMRSFSLNYIMDNIRFFKSVGVNNIEFQDSCFFANKKRGMAIIEAVKMPFKCETRADDVNNELAVFLKKYDCKAVFIGVESGSQRILDMVGKKTDIKAVKNAFRILHEHNIYAIGSFIAGLPTETNNDLYESIDLMLELHTKYNTAIAGFKIFTPYPQTPLYEKTVELGWIPPTTNKGWSAMTRLRECDLPWISKKTLVAGLYALVFLLQSSRRILSSIVLWRLKNKHFELLFEPTLLEWYANLKKSILQKRILGTKSSTEF